MTPSEKGEGLIINWRNRGLNTLCLGGVRGLVEFDVSENHLTEVDLMEFNSTAGCLERLYLAHGKIRAVTNALPTLQLSSLYLLDLSFNRIDRLPDDFFLLMPNLRTLRLEGNLLTTLPQSLGTLENLQWLSIGSDLAGNYIRSLPTDSAVLWSRLEHLYCSRNRFTSLPDITFFKRCPMLRTIRFDHCRIERLGEELNLRPVTQLEELNLSDNCIRRVPPKLRLPTSLKVLDLSNNLIGVIEESSFKSIPPETIVLLSGNGREARMATDENVIGGNTCNETDLKELAARLMIHDSCWDSSPPLTPLVASYLSCPAQTCASCPLRFYRPFCKVPSSYAVAGHPEICCPVAVCSQRCRLKVAAATAEVPNKQQVTSPGTTIMLEEEELFER